MFGIGHHLNDPFSITQIQEDQTPQVAATIHPAHHRDRLVNVSLLDQAAVAGAFQIG
jgi:hypothetical protein